MSFLANHTHANAAVILADIRTEGRELTAGVAYDDVNVFTGTGSQ